MSENYHKYLKFNITNYFSKISSQWPFERNVCFFLKFDKNKSSYVCFRNSQYFSFIFCQPHGKWSLLSNWNHVYFSTARRQKYRHVSKLLPRRHASTSRNFQTLFVPQRQNFAVLFFHRIV